MNDTTKPEPTDLAVSGSSLDIVSRAEYDIQIATAHKYPRSIKAFRNQALELSTLNESIAQQCNYSLPRKDTKTGQVKIIEGASIRFAEIIGSAWGNAHVGTRVIADDGEFITAQAVFHDLERNWKVVEEVQRRVTDKNGRRFSADMIAVTANAARSIAMRNAVLHGVPRPLWEDIAARARKVAAGDQKSLESKRLEAVKAFAVFGVNEAQILATLGRAGLADVTIDDLGTLFGILTAIKDGDTTPEDAFAAVKPDVAMPQPKAAPAPVIDALDMIPDEDGKAANLVRRSTGEVIARGPVGVTGPGPYGPAVVGPAGAGGSNSTHDDPMTRPASAAQRTAILNTAKRLNLTPEEVDAIISDATGFTLLNLPMGAVNPALGAIANHGKPAA